MKNIIKFTIAGCLLISGISCSLEEKVYTQLDESYITTAALAESALNGVYRKIAMEDGIYKQNLSMLFAMPTDEAKPEGSSLTDLRLEGSNAYSSSSRYIQMTWQALYSAVYDANYFLEMMERKMEDFSEEDKKSGALYIAECRALRGLLYFELVRWFGHIPLVLSTEESSRPYSEVVQAKPKDVYIQIEKDLKYAVEHLPYATDDTVRKDNSFRFSKGGALGLLAKVYATWAGYPLYETDKWEDAALAAGELVNSGKHSLLPDFEQLWENAGTNTWNPAESLLELSYYSPAATNESSGRVGNFNGVRSSAGGLRGGNHGHNVFFRVCPTFLTDWKDYQNDRRWAISFADYIYTKDGVKNSVEKTYYIDANGNGKNEEEKHTNVTFEMAWHGEEVYPEWNSSWRALYGLHLCVRKWDTEVYVPDDNNLVDNNYTNVNWYLLRYADALLLYAEALNEFHKGPTAEAYAAVNMVRRRAYGKDIYTVSDEADLEEGLSFGEFRQAVRDERGWELAFEGHRRQDLTRWGIYVETVQYTYQHLGSWHDQAYTYYLAGEYTQKDKHELLPIPLREIDLCPKLNQNTGW